MLQRTRSTWAEQYDARLRAWCAQYGLTQFRLALSGDHCALPLLGKRCRVQQQYAATCPGCMSSAIADHGRYFRNRQLKLFLGQPYNPLGQEEAAQLDRLRAMGLAVHVGGYGDGWHNTGTFPIVISNQPIPAHAYRCAPYEE